MAPQSLLKGGSHANYENYGPSYGMSTCLCMYRYRHRQPLTSDLHLGPSSSLYCCRQLMAVRLRAGSASMALSVAAHVSCRKQGAASIKCMHELQTRSKGTVQCDLQEVRGAMREAHAARDSAHGVHAASVSRMRTRGTACMSCMQQRDGKCVTCANGAGSAPMVICASPYMTFRKQGGGMHEPHAPREGSKCGI
jgi:hypothetical protein